MAARKPTTYHVLIGNKGAFHSCGTVEAVTKDQARSRAKNLDTVGDQLEKIDRQGDLYVIPATSMVPVKVSLKREIRKEQPDG